MRPLFKNLIKLGFTLGAFWWVFQQVQWSELQTAYDSQESKYLWLAGIAIIVQIMCGALRWKMILSALGFKGLGFSTFRVIRMYYASIFFNACMPGTVGGDIARVWLARGEEASTKRMVYGVLLDRIVSLLSLLALTTLTLPWLYLYLGHAQRDGMVLSFAITGGALLAFWLAHFHAPKLEKSPRLAVLNELLSQPLYVMMSLFFGAAAHVAFCAAAYAIALSLGLPLGFLPYLVLVPLVLLFASLPISLGGWGLREMGMTSALALVGVANAPALLIALQLGALNTFISLFGGLVYATYKKAKTH